MYVRIAGTLEMFAVYYMALFRLDEMYRVPLCIVSQFIPSYKFWSPPPPIPPSHIHSMGLRQFEMAIYTDAGGCCCFSSNSICCFNVQTDNRKAHTHHICADAGVSICIKHRLTIGFCHTSKWHIRRT